jgi:hypothetical protein
MSALACAPALFEPPGGGPTLDELIVGAWEGLAAGRTVGCVVCAGELEPLRGTGDPRATGRCKTCGSALG